MPKYSFNRSLFISKNTVSVKTEPTSDLDFDCS